MVTNWAGNVTFAAERVVRPADVDELRRIVASYSSVHALGTGHSFSTVADTRGLLVSVADLPHEVEVVDGGAAVRVSAGTTFGELALALDPATVAALYPRLDDFRSLADRLDPDGVFTNDFVETYVRRPG